MTEKGVQSGAVGYSNDRIPRQVWKILEQKRIYHFSGGSGRDQNKHRNSEPHSHALMQGKDLRHPQVSPHDPVCCKGQLLPIVGWEQGAPVTSGLEEALIGVQAAQGRTSVD